jgi:hypothetical protein
MKSVQLARRAHPQLYGSYDAAMQAAGCPEVGASFETCMGIAILIAFL